MLRSELTAIYPKTNKLMMWQITALEREPLNTELQLVAERRTRSSLFFDTRVSFAIVPCELNKLRHSESYSPKRVRDLKQPKYVRYRPELLQY